MTHVHLIGIGGTGLSAIARLLLERGYTVSGSDRCANQSTRELEAAGAAIFLGHHTDHIQGADWVVRSSAIPDENPEVAASLQAGIPVFKRSEFLGRLMEGATCVAVAGTHGKTTTTAMIAWILADAGLNPSYIIGSTAQNLGTNAHAGTGPFVIEADEYDYMFLGLTPDIAVITTVEHDHPDCFPTVESYQDAFVQFVQRISSNGTLILSGDDPVALKMAEHIRPLQSMITYGISSKADLQAVNLLSIPGSGYAFDATGYGGDIVHIELQVPGIHNVRNAMGALAAAIQCGVSVHQAATSLGRFTGTGRRFEKIGEVNGIILISDYAHHPTEIRTTLAAARSRYPRNRIWAIWQPHTYSRTQSLMNEFAAAFTDADQVIVTAIYAARETNPSFTAQQVVDCMNHPAVQYLPEIDFVTTHLINTVQPGDVVVVLSAGDANRILPDLLQKLEEKE
ncbi:MAG TPA: UDP-N-acetylmuramate--L-alanine ligase [Anaerolineaceae bacterium]|nr:UDP-N-acetylmuramate--L-alanine ligase [Anaerolineaceae bacterium]HQP60127.1 UDP-N-acetylmuramate--L-alanine ligase [Anaerolineaceae bacterium]